MRKQVRMFVLFLILLGVMVEGHGVLNAQAVSEISLTGTLNVVWGETHQHHDHEHEHIVYLLTEANGRTSRLYVTADVLERAGGIGAINRQTVRVQATQARAVYQALAPITARNIDVIGRDARYQARVSGARPWITVMCKFSDVIAEPRNYTYFANMYGDAYPGFNHYWKEQSFNIANIDGSAVAGTGWFTLPNPRSTYVVNGALNFGLISQDCAGAADSVVNFGDYTGINMMFNDNLDGAAWGGSTTITVDGRSTTMSATWMPPWGYIDISVLAHEMGHGFGLPHSSGQYGATYDSAWDMMSDPFWNCGASSSLTYGCLGQHTIAYHKDILGWIPSNQKYVAFGSATIIIDDLAMASTTNYRMARIPINKLGTRYYTVEVRKLTGYDVKLPGYAVVIHQVQTTRDRPAQVVDSDGNGNTGDAGAMWTTGETFSDATIGLTVAVNAQTANGYSVTISIPVPTATLSPTIIPAKTNVGRFAGWGQSIYGQITAPNTNSDIVDISAGAFHTLVLRSDGRVSGWGYNGDGQISVPATLTDVVAVSAGYAHSLALKSDGTVVGWGYNDYGQATPPSDLRDVVAISAGIWHSLALQSDGTVIGWGFNGYGETSAPETVVNAVAIGANAQSSMAVLADGSVVAWGFLGATNQLAVPTDALKLLPKVVDIAVGRNHAVALLADGRVTTWGDNTANQRNVPAGLTNVVEISTAEDHTIARTANGGVYVWGKNTSNQLNVPATVRGVLGVAAGYNHSVVFFNEANLPTATATMTRTHTRTRTPTLVRPAAFNKSAPTNNMANRPLRVTLSWGASRLATSYEYCIALSTTTCTTWKNVGNATSVTLTNLQRNRAYFWNVRAKNGGGVTVANGSLWKFTTVR